MRILLRPFVVVLLVLVASGAAASPAPRPAALSQAEPAALRLPALFARLESLLASVWSKEGCRMDPLGRCIQSAPTTDAGCRADPWGRCESDQ